MNNLELLFYLFLFTYNFNCQITIKLCLLCLKCKISSEFFFITALVDLSTPKSSPSWTMSHSSPSHLFAGGFRILDPQSRLLVWLYPIGFTRKPSLSNYRFSFRWWDQATSISSWIQVISFIKLFACRLFFAIL